MKQNEVKNIVRANSLIEAHYRLSLGEMKIVYYVMARAYKDKKIETVEIPPMELAKFCQINSNGYARVFDELTTKLMKKIVYIKDKNGEDWVKYNWVSRCEYSKGRCFLKLNTDLEPFILNLNKAYLKEEFKTLMMFTSVYSVRLYELCRQYAKIGSRRFEVDEFKEEMGVTGKAYDKFFNVKARVIEPAISEIGEKTNTRIEVEYITAGRTTIAIVLKFYTLEKKPSEIQSSNRDIFTKFGTVGLSNILDILEDIYPDEEMRKIYLQYGGSYAAANMKYCFDHRPDNISAYYMKAFMNNFADAPRHEPKPNCSLCNGTGIILRCPEGDTSPENARYFECACYKE